MKRQRAKFPWDLYWENKKLQNNWSKEVYLKHLFLANSRDPRHVVFAYEVRVPHVTEYIVSRSTNQLLLCERYGR